MVEEMTSKDVQRDGNGSTAALCQHCWECGVTRVQINVVTKAHKTCQLWICSISI